MMEHHGTVTLWRVQFVDDLVIVRMNTLPRPSLRLHFSTLNNQQTLNRPLFAANCPALRATSTTTPYSPVMATTTRRVRVSTWKPLLHMGTPPAMYAASTHCNSANIVHLICCSQGCPEAWYTGETKQMLQQRMNGHSTTITKQGCSLPFREHFSDQGHSPSGLQVTILQGERWDTQQRKVVKQTLTVKFSTHQSGLNQDPGSCLTTGDPTTHSLSLTHI
ncbi:uncharacterized protein LOC122541641 [Chiloscyllium plagiosum]|uniref:uncharacterized protein LOC122541641 n=1 Tax=Chiloscyllium plagiosum TaxID=36176 RepID=UPI001CB88318|nr:uncharacterized protein LOC122541641 [Chiloscyllium plagiosum]